jgi:hypothetical protein
MAYLSRGHSAMTLVLQILGAWLVLSVVCSLLWALVAHHYKTRTDGCH